MEYINGRQIIAIIDMKLLKRILIKYFPTYLISMLKNVLIKKFQYYSNISYSEVGEDVLLYKLFHPRKSENIPVQFKRNGLYIDIGCNHPVSNSQTYFMYKNGWQGLCIDPSPIYTDLYKSIRPRDKYLQFGVSEIPGELNYYQYDLDVINSFDFPKSEKLALELNAKFLNEVKVPVKRLEDILSENLSSGQIIDFLSIDTEGHEEFILKSNNWQLYRPKFILIEIHDFDILNPIKNNIVKYLINYNYKLINVLGHNCLFEDELNPKFSHFS